MEFWHNRWHTQQIGWHRAVYNDMLLKHWPSINAVEGSQVIVPLCGKSLDMLWLAEQGYSVVGLEMVEEAVMAFFEENSLQYISEKKLLTQSTAVKTSRYTREMCSTSKPGL